MSKINITVYRWAGAWGPFKVNIPCGECTLTKDIIQDTLDNELAGIDVTLDMRDWLSEWWKPLLQGGWHAPIVLVNGRIVSQGEALNRGLLTQIVTQEYARKMDIKGNHVFGKANCPHCTRAKNELDKAGIDYIYHDVVKDSQAMYEMLDRVKPLIGPKTPITVPQIWIEGLYVGGADSVSKLLRRMASLRRAA
jgi:glutaredoxin